MAYYSMTKLEFVNIMMERKIREKMSGRTVVNQYQVVIGECWESKFNYKPNWDDCSPHGKLEKLNLRNNYTSVIAKYVTNSKSSRQLSFGINDDVLVSTEKYPILFKIPEPVTVSQKKYHTALKALEMKFNEAKKELEKKFMQAKSQLDKKFGILNSLPPSPTPPPKNRPSMFENNDSNENINGNDDNQIQKVAKEKLQFQISYLIDF